MHITFCLVEWKSEKKKKDKEERKFEGLFMFLITPTIPIGNFSKFAILSLSPCSL